MKYRWTNKELQETKNIDFIEQLLNERESNLTNIYSPLSQKIKEAKRMVGRLKSFAENKETELNKSDAIGIHKILNDN